MVMCGLGIDGVADRAWLCATDGHRLIRMPIAGTVPGDIATVLSAEEIDKAIKRAEAGDVRGTGTEGALLIVLPWIKRPEHDMAFPPTGQVVPTGASRGTGEIPWFAPTYLASAAKVGETFVKITGYNSGSLTMGIAHMGGSLDPFRLDVNLRGETIAQIVIMPMRADACEVPATHRASAPPREMTQDERDAVAGAPDTTVKRAPEPTVSATVAEAA